MNQYDSVKTLDLYPRSAGFEPCTMTNILVFALESQGERIHTIQNRPNT